MRILAALALLTPSAAFLLPSGCLLTLQPSLSRQVSCLGSVPQLRAGPIICSSKPSLGIRPTLLARGGAAGGGSDEGRFVTDEDERVAEELQEWLEDVFMEVDYEVRGFCEGVRWR